MCMMMDLWKKNIDYINKDLKNQKAELKLERSNGANNFLIIPVA